MPENHYQACLYTLFDMKRKGNRMLRTSKYIIYKQTLIKPSDHFWTFVGAFIGISAIGIIQGSDFLREDNIFLIGSFGASAVLVFGASSSPLAQPRNLILGHLISAFIGVSVHQFFPDMLWFASALAVALSIVAMQITKSMHPPGGATALIANIGSEKIKSLGYYFVFSPVLSGVLILFATALVINNIPSKRSYPYRLH